MTKEKTSLSDWIEFLNEITNRRNTYIIGMLTLSFSFFMAVLLLFSMSLNISSLQTSEVVKTHLINSIINLIYLFIGGALSLIFFTLLIIMHPYFEHAKAIKLLKKIMENEEEIEIDDIRKEWFKKREKKMFKDISIFVWKEIRTGAITVGIGIFVIGLILMMFGTEFFPITYSQWLTSFGLGVLALGVAFHSIVISKESDEKMRSVANADFFEITYRFWEKAPYLYYSMDFRKRDTCSWNLINFFEQADKLKKWVDSDLQKRLIKELKTFLERLQSTKCKKAWVEIKNYTNACKIAIGFKADEEVKNELINQLGYYIGYKNEGETNRQYLERKSRELVSRERFDTFERVIEKI